MKKEPAAHHYHRKATECELNAEKTTNAADRHAWQCLAEDWLKLARARSTLLQTVHALIQSCSRGPLGS